MFLVRNLGFLSARFLILAGLTLPATPLVVAQGTPVSPTYYCVRGSASAGGGIQVAATPLARSRCFPTIDRAKSAASQIFGLPASNPAPGVTTNIPSGVPYSVRGCWLSGAQLEPGHYYFVRCSSGLIVEMYRQPTA